MRMRDIFGCCKKVSEHHGISSAGPGSGVTTAPQIPQCWASWWARGPKGLRDAEIISILCKNLVTAGTTSQSKPKAHYQHSNLPTCFQQRRRFAANKINNSQWRPKGPYNFFAAVKKGNYGIGPGLELYTNHFNSLSTKKDWHPDLLISITSDPLNVRYPRISLF